MALTPKQELFIKEYLVDLNATQAYLRAGYKCSEEVARRNGSRLLTNADISRAIEEAKAARAEKLDLTAQWVLDRLVEVTERCMQAEEVMKWDYEERQMVPTGEYQFDSKGANTALQLIGKHLGMFVEKVQLKGDMFVGIKLPEGIDDE